jgi:Domain of unknown function (DUF4381)
MAAPTLPAQVAIDAKAQAVLDQLHPLLQPEPPSWAPQTAGWLVLGALLAMGATWTLWRAARRWHAKRYRRQALAELHYLRQQLQSPDARAAAARRLPELVRRLALAHAPRDQVAGLQGADWLNWLDRSLPGTGHAFSQGAGRSLVDWAYRPADDLPWDELEPLLALLAQWIRQHQPPGAAP